MRDTTTEKYIFIVVRICKYLYLLAYPRSERPYWADNAMTIYCPHMNIKPLNGILVRKSYHSGKGSNTNVHCCSLIIALLIYSFFNRFTLFKNHILQRYMGLLACVRLSLQFCPWIILIINSAGHWYRNCL